jgi:hypothetical protein
MSSQWTNPPSYAGSQLTQPVQLQPVQPQLQPQFESIEKCKECESDVQEKLLNKAMTSGDLVVIEKPDRFSVLKGMVAGVSTFTILEMIRVFFF